jgi:hypothetical protein
LTSDSVAAHRTESTTTDSSSNYEEQAVDNSRIATWIEAVTPEMAPDPKLAGGKELKRINIHVNYGAEKVGMKSYASLLKKCGYLHLISHLLSHLSFSAH